MSLSPDNLGSAPSPPRRRASHAQVFTHRMDRTPASPAPAASRREGDAHREERRGDLGNLYRLLRSLEEDGVVDSDRDDGLPGPAKRVYRLTDSGRELLARWAAALGEARMVITAFIDRHEGEGVST